jgi:hypothetical protein
LKNTVQSAKGSPPVRLQNIACNVKCKYQDASP